MPNHVKACQPSALKACVLPAQKLRWQCAGDLHTAPNTPRSPRGQSPGDPRLSKRLLRPASKRRSSFHLFRHSPKAPSESSGTHHSDNEDFNVSPVCQPDSAEISHLISPCRFSCSIVAWRMCSVHEGHLDSMLMEGFGNQPLQREETQSDPTSRLSPVIGRRSCKPLGCFQSMACAL